MKLSDQQCVPYEGGVTPLAGLELEKYRHQLDEESRGWELVGGKQLRKCLKFKNFRSALDFVNKIGQIAEIEGHHPNIEFGWGFVKVLVWSHAIDGLSEADFVLAAKIG